MPNLLLELFCEEIPALAPAAQRGRKNAGMGEVRF